MTGILVPADKGTDTAQNDSVSGEELYRDVMEDAEDEDIAEDASVNPYATLLNPVLNPDRLPSSAGLSFVLKPDNGVASISLCVTWGRYLEQNQEEGRKVWKRKSYYAVEENIQIDGDAVKEVIKHPEGLSVSISTRKTDSDNYYVSVFAVNRMPGGVPENTVFQPQIRVVIDKGLPVELDRNIFESEKDGLFDFPFSKSQQKVFARGIMCSAVWKEIDPLNPDNYDKFRFMWPDGEYIREKEPHVFSRFISCNLRTEFIPLIVQGTPDFDIAGLEYDPLELSGLSPEMVNQYFKKLVESYRNWIDEKNGTIMAEQNGEKAKLAEKLLDFHRQALKRIESGIELLRNNREAMLSFNFANRVIYTVQNEWAGNRNFRWRAFQIAFFLMVLESAVNPRSEHRKTADILWVPTGGGKTEAYLLLSLFLLAYRRRVKGAAAYGTAILSRYTLRMLTVQQFNRALKAITAAEYLRVYRKDNAGFTGWIPPWAEEDGRYTGYVWGNFRFSAGLWVGSGITPNKLGTSYYGGRKPVKGAIDLLKESAGRDGSELSVVTRCPACGAYLILPEIFSASKSKSGENRDSSLSQVHMLIRLTPLKGGTLNPEDVRSFLKATGEYIYTGDSLAAGVEVLMQAGNTVSIRIDIVHTDDIRSKDVEEKVWREIKRALETQFKVEELSLSFFTPGYFPWGEDDKGGPLDFQIICPDGECILSSGKIEWDEHVPSNNGGTLSIFELQQYRNQKWMKNFVPVPAYFVDEQIYSKLPSFVIATVDKFARLPFEPATAAIFGNVDRYIQGYGYVRKDIIYSAREEYFRRQTRVSAEKPEPPSLIIQDELHLIEGPLGSLTGLYETAVDELCLSNGGPVKYIASTATIKHADRQVKALFLREAFQFPPAGISIEDNFFSRIRYMSLEEALDNPDRPGKIYTGVIAPAKGPLTPQVRIYSRLWVTAKEIEKISSGKKLLPVVGYYNAVKELAGGRKVLDQDIRERLRTVFGIDQSDLPDSVSIVELSSRIESGELPHIMEKLEKTEIDPSFIISTSIFGTGVDISGLRLMVVNGQPKRTSEYIQATGRVGRKNMALVVTLYRPSRPRDLSHYEYFAGYHLHIYRYVEEAGVYPFAKGSVLKAAGPVLVSVLRNSPRITNDWTGNGSAANIISHSMHSDIDYAISCIIERNSKQPQEQQIDGVYLENLLRDRYQGTDRWKNIARQYSDIRFVDYNGSSTVVLGDMKHEQTVGEHRIVYRRVPGSLRNVEGTVEIRIVRGRSSE